MQKGNGTLPLCSSGNPAENAQEEKKKKASRSDQLKVFLHPYVLLAEHAAERCGAIHMRARSKYHTQAFKVEFRRNSRSHSDDRIFNFYECAFVPSPGIYLAKGAFDACRKFFKADNRPIEKMRSSSLIFCSFYKQCTTHKRTSASHSSAKRSRNATLFSTSCRVSITLALTLVQRPPAESPPTGASTIRTPSPPFALPRTGRRFPAFPSWEGGG